MLRIRFHGGGEGQQRGLVRQRHRGEGRPAEGQRAGLVEDDDLELARPLERDPVLDEQAVAAPSEVLMAMTSGIARPSAWGQAMTSTVAVRTRAPSRSPWSHQNRRVTAPAASAT